MTGALFTASVSWALRPGDAFAPGRYCRAHTVRFDNGVTLDATASPHVVGKWADPSGVDPEELLVASLSSCHMLSILHVARLAGFVVGRYDDEASGRMTEIAPGPRVRLGQQAAGLPVRALHRPRDHVLEAAERRDAPAGRLRGAKPVVGLDVRAAPTTCRTAHDREATPGSGGRC